MASISDPNIPHPGPPSERAVELNERKSHLRALALAGTLAVTGLFTALAASETDDGSGSADQAAPSSGVAAAPSAGGEVDSDDAVRTADDSQGEQGRRPGQHHHDFGQGDVPADGFQAPDGDYFSRTPDGSLTPGQQGGATAPSMSGGS